MQALRYLYGRIWRNRVRRALRKPVTYVYLAFLLLYLFMIPYSLKMLVEQFGGDSPEGMAAVLTIVAFWLIPANLIAYAKRKGLVYRNSDVHFLFPSPVSPKGVLLYAYIRTLAIQVLLNLFAVICGGALFHVEVWRLGVYFLFALGVENLLEGSVMLLFYGSERLGEKQRALLVKTAYALTGVLVLMGIYTYFTEGLSINVIIDFLNSDMVQMVPVVGWYIAVVHLLLMGPTVVNVAGSVCYLLLLFVVMAAAWRMKCTGAYYEDAIKFAEDYEEVLASRRQGDTQKKLGKKQRFGKARVSWKGHGARALFYRQLLEYKKSRFFIFDANTVAALLAGVGVAYLYIHEGGFGGFEPYVIPCVAAYVIFIFTAMGGKWAKELLSPYTYMIPDTPFRKMVNSMGMQHVQSLINACLLTIPGAVVMGLPLPVAALGIIFYVAVYANKLYALAVAEIVTGSALGKTGKQLFQMLIQSIALMMAALGAFAGAQLGGVWMAYAFMDVTLVLITIIFMVIAMLNFYKMETA